MWTDLFYAVERLVEGDRRERIKKDAADFTMRRLFEILAKHSIWLLIAWWTGGAWVLYFTDAPTLVRDLLQFQAPTIAYIWIAILTFTTYVLAGFMREQVCVYMCPWPRIQAALTDEWALNVTYKRDRGEERTSLKKANELRAAGQPAGDCIDCLQCVAVCPTGIDIRNGPQMECIQCGLCIDACDRVMEKIGRPNRLIGYDNDINIQRRLSGKGEVFRPIRARTIIYAAIIALVGAIMLYSLATRRFLDVNVLHDRNPISVRLSDGSIRNAYTIRILNKRSTGQSVAIVLAGIPEAKLQLVGIDSETSEQPTVKIGRDRTIELRALVTAPSTAVTHHSVPLEFKVTDMTSGEVGSATDNFVTP